MITPVAFDLDAMVEAAQKRLALKLECAVASHKLAMWLHSARTNERWFVPAFGKYGEL